MFYAGNPFYQFCNIWPLFAGSNSLLVTSPATDIQYSCAFQNHQKIFQNSLKDVAQSPKLFQPIILEKKKNNEVQIETQRKKTQRTKKQEEYKPHTHPKKKIRKEHQNQNRNILPNSIHQIISFLQKRAKSGALLDKLLTIYPHDPSWTSEKFYFYMKVLKEKLDHYVSEQTLSKILDKHDQKCQIYSNQEQEFYLKMCRIMLNRFFNGQSNIMILTSKRMHVNKKKAHLWAKRYLSDKFQELLEKKHRQEPSKKEKV